MRYLVLGGLLLAACAAGDLDTGSTDTSGIDSTTLATVTGTTEPDPGAPAAPEVPSGPVGPAVEEAVDLLLTGVLTTDWDVGEVDGLVETGDPRTAWLLADLLRFYQHGDEVERLALAFSELTGAELDPDAVQFVSASNRLIAWDMPAWDRYPQAKQRIFGPLEETWDRFFAEDRHIDWRLVTWGGVGPDTRPLDDNGPCPCIPALDHPATTDADGGDWYPDRDIVFGVVVEGEALALPKHQMEVHEMVHVTLGDRELGIPYCTLCGSAQAYYVDDVPGVDRVVLRTSGLLSRSNKLMYDLSTGSAFDTFTGRALSGTLAGEGVTLGQVSVVASTWGDWKEAHPETRIVAEDGGIGRTYIVDPLGGRDAAGPIFPVGDVDPRLPTQEKVVGVIKGDGTPVAFPVQATRERLADGHIEFKGLTVRLVDSVRVFDAGGDELVSHESFWFAWSQFHPGTLLWSAQSG
ncbi:MAG TPA: DUF3179 domain-containing (seleno)protein [Acidimicrobiia bacterium]|nr:DUF3179 domain-containing (seleno)protein [Acidimicrobiia bacterium]